MEQQRDGTPIIVTELDNQRLETLITTYLEHDESSATALQDELDHAEVVSATEVPAAIVTMQSRVSLRDDRGRRIEATLVFPWQADAASGKISVLAPMGVALLGARQGDRIRVRTDRSARTWHLEEVRFQPEAAGLFDL